VARIATRQQGVVGRRQLLELGLSSARIDRWIATGHLHRIHRGVYALGYPNPTLEGRWMAATLATGPSSLISHTDAAKLLHLLKRTGSGPVHVSVANRSARSIPRLIVHRPRNLDPRDRWIRQRIPVTSATRTVWDLATVVPPSRTRRAFEQAEKFDLLDRERLTALADGTPNRRGAGLIRILLAERPLPLSETRSLLEDVLVRICAHHGLEMPATNVPVLDYEVDLLWPRERFVVEADGGDHRGPQRDKDNARDLNLARAGYLVRRYSSNALEDERAVAAEIVAILAERRAVARSTRARATAGG
jgi:very-short-patch-repair endonuclease